MKVIGRSRLPCGPPAQGIPARECARLAVEGARAMFAEIRARPDSSVRFTHAVLTCPSRPSLEVHTGVGVVGQSKVVHEADVLVLPQDDANRCRNFDLDPQGRDAELMMEAKYYTNPVGLGTDREFLGLRVDVSAK